VRPILIFAVLMLSGCGPGLVFDNSYMTPDQMLQRADHIFIGVIVDQQLQAWPFFRVPGQKPGDWAILRRRIRLENVLRGVEPRTEVDIYEVFGLGGKVGDWNSTEVGERDLFLVRLENDRYHVVRDHWRSIFRIRSGTHVRLPLSDSHPFWERVGLLMWWVRSDWTPAVAHFPNDPGNVLGRWREVKLLRGLLQHPNHDLRLAACAALLAGEPWEDECWDQLTSDDQKSLANIEDAQRRHKEQFADRHKAPDMFAMYSANPQDMDRVRLLTTESNASFRREVCQLFLKRFPDDHDNGCTPNLPPPATIVTADGDVPLTGPWPVEK
jgi:hypothetical protein